MEDTTTIWARDGETFREALRPGTVLETYDCGYITVNSVTPDGVLADTLFERDYLWDWNALIRLECLIYHQPKEGEVPIRTVGKLRRRGGIIPADPVAADAFEPGMTEEQLIAQELGRALGAEGFSEGLFRADTRYANGTWTCIAGPYGGGLVDHSAMQPHLEALVAKFGTTGMPPVVAMELEYFGNAPVPRYMAKYTYEGE